MRCGWLGPCARFERALWALAHVEYPLSRVYFQREKETRKECSRCRKVDEEKDRGRKKGGWIIAARKGARKRGSRYTGKKKSLGQGERICTAVYEQCVYLHICQGVGMIGSRREVTGYRSMWIFSGRPPLRGLTEITGHRTLRLCAADDTRDDSYVPGDNLSPSFLPPIGRLVSSPSSFRYTLSPLSSLFIFARKARR